LIEKWSVAATLAQRAGGKRFAALKADSVLLINVTDDFARTILSTYWMLFSEERGHTTTANTAVGTLSYCYQLFLSAINCWILHGCKVTALAHSTQC
jgi:hypothetical protein